jgi:hypothetical protein
VTEEVDTEKMEDDILADSSEEQNALALAQPPARKLCVRHQRMADEGTNLKLQQVSSSQRFSISCCIVRVVGPLGLDHPVIVFLDMPYDSFLSFFCDLF